MYQNHLIMCTENQSRQTGETDLFSPVPPSPLSRMAAPRNQRKIRRCLAGVSVSMIGGLPESYATGPVSSLPSPLSPEVPETHWPVPLKRPFLHAPICFSKSPIIQTHIKVWRVSRRCCYVTHDTGGADFLGSV